jgi:O-antigen/teichoic acid export membrane protein
MLTVRRLVARHVPEARFRLRSANATTDRELWTSGSRNAVISLAGTISYGCDTVVVGLLLPVANAAYYAVAAKLVNLVNELSTRPVTTLIPAYSHAQAVRQDQRQFRLFTESVTFSLAICLPFVIALCAFGNRIVEAWVGLGHAAAFPIAAVLGIALLMILPGYACFTILTGNDRTALLAKLYIVAAGANLALSIWLTSRAGAIGVALGSMITAAVVDFGVLPVLVCHEFGFRYRGYLSLALRPLLAPLVVATAAAVGLRWAHPEPRRISTLFMLAGVVGPAWVAWLAVGLDRSRRQIYFRSLRSLIAKR